MKNTNLYLYASVLIASVISTANASICSITFGESGDSKTLEINTDINPIQKLVIGGQWSFIRRTSGPCIFKVYNGSNYDGSSVTYGTSIDNRIRIGAKGAQDSGGWRARSLEVRGSFDTSCAITLGDSGVSQTFFGLNNHVYDLTGWSFVRNTRGLCMFRIFNTNDVASRNETLQSNINYRYKAPWRIRSVHLIPDPAQFSLYHIPDLEPVNISIQRIGRDFSAIYVPVINHGASLPHLNFGGRCSFNHSLGAVDLPLFLATGQRISDKVFVLRTTSFNVQVKPLYASCWINPLGTINEITYGNNGIEGNDGQMTWLH